MIYDAVIIGSGPAGYECAKKISELGGKAAVVEQEKVGGTCTNFGCIPTKALHATATFLSELRKSSKLVFAMPSPKVDFKAIMQRKDRIVDTMSLGVKKILDEGKVEFFRGAAKIKDANTVVVLEKELKCKNIVIATGAKPKMIPGIPISGLVLSSKELLEQNDIPGSLVIVGGGYIGCEFASIFSWLGSKVTIIEMLPRITFLEDEDISKELTNLMQRQGADVFTNAKFLGAENNTVRFIHESIEKEIPADKVLIAVGVSPYFDKEEMKKLGVQFGNGILVNNRMQTNIPNIYAIGDVTGQIMLAHFAYAQAEIAALNIMGNDKTFDEKIVPSAIFTIPEISSVGEKDPKYKTSTFRFALNGKARAMGDIEGFVKIFHDGEYLKGFSAIGPHVSDLVAEATLAIKNSVPLKSIKDTIHVHPTLSEAFLGAVELALKK